MSPSLLEWQEELHSEKGGHFLSALSQVYISMAALDLNTRTALVLSSKLDQEIVGSEISWEALLQRYTERRLYPEDKDWIFAQFSFEKLLLFWESGVGEKSIELRCLCENTETYDWVEVIATVLDREYKHLLITTRNISETKLQKRVFDKFLYHQNCDFFILLSLDTNSYQVFDVGAGLLPIPDTQRLDYTADMTKYNSQYVVKSEADKAISLMSIESIREQLADKEEFSYTVGILTDSGEYRRARMQLIVFDRGKNQVILTRSDVTSIYIEEKRRNAQLIHALRAAQRDQLTGLYNQSATEEIVSQMLLDYQGKLAAVLFIDVDNFKMVNDTLGHLQGNELLKKLSAFLKTMLSADSIAGRIGGDEFLLFLTNIPSAETALELGQRICGAFESFKDLTAQLPVSCSVGIALYPPDGLTYRLLVQKADQALYRSKRYGKNYCSFYSEDLEHYQYLSAVSEID